MEMSSPSLSDQLLRLRHTAQAVESRAWLPEAIHALIAAIFARLFSRLEHIIQLWQAGQLPLPQSRETSRSIADDTSHRDSTRVLRPHPARQTRHSILVAISRTGNAPRAASYHLTQPAGATPSRAARSSVRPRRQRRPARAPPPAISANRPGPFAGEHIRALFVTI